MIALVGDGTLIEYGATTEAMHSEDGMSDYIWWSSENLSGALLALEALRGRTRNPAASGAVLKHSDRLVESAVYRYGTSTPTPKYLDYTEIQLKAGKGERLDEPLEALRSANL